MPYAIIVAQDTSVQSAVQDVVVALDRVEATLLLLLNVTEQLLAVQLERLNSTAG
jgi:hypothetical protein